MFDYIEAENPRAAIAVDETIRDQVRRLVEFPDRGRPGRVNGTRELVVPGYYPYTVAYRVSEDAVVILRVLHHARQWPDDLPDQSR